VHHLDAGARLEQFAGELRDRPGAVGRVSLPAQAFTSAISSAMPFAGTCGLIPITSG
jgi:hypothetical protein